MIKEYVCPSCGTLWDNRKGRGDLCAHCGHDGTKDSPIPGPAKANKERQAREYGSFLPPNWWDRMDSAKATKARKEQALGLRGT